MKMSAHSQGQYLLPMELQESTLSPEASRAKTLALLESSAAWAKEPDQDYGPKSSDLLASYDLSSSSWRTSQLCLLARATGEADGLAEFSETWPSAGMMLSGKTYRLEPWAIPTCESARGFWPTPNKSNGFAPFSLATMQRKVRGESRPSGCKMGFDLKWEPRCLPYLERGWINPIITEWLMGFPIGHTDLQPAATPSSPKSPNSSGEPS